MLPLHDYAAAKALLDAEEGATGIDRNEWKHRMWSPQEHIGIKVQKAASRTYYRCRDTCPSMHAQPRQSMHVTKGLLLMRAGLSGAL